MALTVLQVTNLVLRKASVLGTDLSALTGNAQQEDVDAAIDAINEVVDELQSLGRFPAEVGEGSITLATGDRDYAVAADFAQFDEDLFVCESDGSVLYPYDANETDKGYRQLRAVQLQPDNQTGAPNYWTLDPTSGQIYLDRIPTSVENGKVYRYLYQKETGYTSASAATTFLFNDECLRRMVPACVEVFDRQRRSRFNEKSYQKSIANAAKLLSRTSARKRYGPTA